MHPYGCTTVPILFYRSPSKSRSPVTGATAWTDHTISISDIVLRLIFRTRLLHLRDMLLRTSRIQPSYCFPGPTGSTVEANPITIPTGSHLKGELTLGRVPDSSRFARIPIQRPIPLHAGTCCRYLVLAHSSCRHRSPVSSGARSATFDSSNRPLSSSEFPRSKRPCRPCARSRATSRQSFG